MGANDVQQQKQKKIVKIIRNAPGFAFEARACS